MTLDTNGLLDFDSLTEGAALTVSAPWSLNGVTPTVKATAAKHGAKGVEFATTTAAGRIQYDYGSALTTRSLVMSGYYEHTGSMPSANCYLMAVLSLPTGGAVLADWRVNPTGTVAIRNNGSVTPNLTDGTSTIALTLGTTYRFSWTVDPVADTQELRVYLGEAATPLFTLTGAYTGTATRVAAFGVPTAGGSGGLRVDTLRVADAVLGPFDPGGTGPAIDTTLTFDSLSEGATINAAALPAGWSTSGVTAIAKATAAAHGARGARWADTTAYGRMQYDYGSNQTARAVVADVYFTAPTFPTTAPLYLAGILSLTSNGSVQGDARVNSNGAVALRNATTAVATSTIFLVPGTRYRAAWKVNDVANTQDLRLYIGEAVTPLFTLTGAYTSVLTRVATVGPNLAAPGGALDIDTVRLANDWLPPFATAAPVYVSFRKTAGGTLQPLALTRI